jgi:putative hemolysin
MCVSPFRHPEGAGCDSGCTGKESRSVISIERTLLERFPTLARPRARLISRPMIALLRRLACEERINRTLGQLQGESGFGFVERVLQALKFSYTVAPTERENIPVEGRVVIVANHPLGALDAIALLDLVGGVRRDVRILANEVLMQLEPLRPLVLPISVFGEGGGAGLREAYRALEREEALIVFPAGEVSRLRGVGVRDPRWTDGFLRLALKTGAPVLPVHVGGHNSAAFYGLSMLAKPLSMLLLAREMFGNEEGRVTINVGAVVPTHALKLPGLSSRRIAARMRRHVYRLPRRKPPRFQTSNAIAHPESPVAIRRALAQGERLGTTFDGKQIVLLDPAPDDPALREIGRLREFTFRRVGEGTGSRRDLDRFDSHYRHIVLWDAEALRIVGAYRLGEGSAILERHGMGGLYSHSLFEYAERAAGFLREGVELGRSFVVPAYWGSRSLDYLWQGIGAYLKAHPHTRYLFGPVSLSAGMPAEARDWLVHYHAHYYPDPDGLARARNPYRVSEAVAATAREAWRGRDARDGLVELRGRLSALGVAMPVLYRQYVDLVEPEAGGVRFLDFGVDPSFGNCIDGLIRVDLACLKPGKRARYIGG